MHGKSWKHCRLVATGFLGSKQRRKQLAGKILALQVAWLLLSTELPAVETSTAEVVRVGYVKAASALPLFVALECKLFPSEVVQVRPKIFAQTSELISALYARQLDLACGVGWPVVLAAEVADPGKVWVFNPSYETTNHAALAVLRPKGLIWRELKELEGKTVGCFPGASMRVFAQEIFRAAGGNPARVHWLQVPVTAQTTFLAGQQVVALFTVEPYVTAAEVAGIAEIADANPRPRLLWSPFPAGVDVASREWATRAPWSFRAIETALRKASERIEAGESQSEIRKLLAAYTDVDATVADRIRLYVWPGQVDTNSVAKLVRLLVAHGQLDKEVAIQDLLP